MATQTLSNFLSLYGGSHVGGQLTFVLQPILPYNIEEDLQTSEVNISETFDLSDIKFGRVVKNAIFHNI